VEVSVQWKHKIMEVVMFIKNVASVNMRYHINLINGSFTYKYLISVMHPTRSRIEKNDFMPILVELEMYDPEIHVSKRKSVDLHFLGNVFSI